MQSCVLTPGSKRLHSSARLHSWLSVLPDSSSLPQPVATSHNPPRTRTHVSLRSHIHFRYTRGYLPVHSNFFPEYDWITADHTTLDLHLDPLARPRLVGDRLLHRSHSDELKACNLPTRRRQGLVRYQSGAQGSGPASRYATLWIRTLGREMPPVRVRWGEQVRRVQRRPGEGGSAKKARVVLRFRQAGVCCARDGVRRHLRVL